MSTASFAVVVGEHNGSILLTAPLTLTVSQQNHAQQLDETIYLNSLEQRIAQGLVFSSTFLVARVTSTNELERVVDPIFGDNKSRRTLSAGLDTRGRLLPGLDYAGRLQYRAREDETMRLQSELTLAYRGQLRGLGVSAELEASAKDIEPSLGQVITSNSDFSSVADVEDVNAMHVDHLSFGLDAVMPRLAASLVLVSANVHSHLVKSDTGLWVNTSESSMSVNMLSLEARYSVFSALDMLVEYSPVEKQDSESGERLRYTTYKVGAKCRLNKALNAVLVAERGSNKLYRWDGQSSEKLALTLGYRLSSHSALKLKVKQVVATSLQNSGEVSLSLSATL